MIALGKQKRRRAISLTPMIDVVFLLLVFFMLASRFGLDHYIPLTASSGGTAASENNQPRIVDILPDAIRLNGERIDEAELIRALEALTDTINDPIVIRARDEARLQRLVDVAEQLGSAGFQRLVMAQ
ncbi:MAG: biopolymer transporter ExbD [Pseudomonadota bacterium]